ncbi:MAG: PEP-CTERM sorting domain-containing protein [Planctomycetes bacterium]|nr:PEP-CTERM sorting domain-containing protein [Planctomycetota bacterium]
MRMVTAVLAVFVVAVSATASHAQAVSAPFTWKGVEWQEGNMSGTDMFLPGGSTGNLEWNGYSADSGDANNNTNDLFTDLTLVNGAASSSRWRISFSFIDTKRSDDDWMGIEGLAQTLASGNARISGGATMPMTAANDLTWRLASDRSTPITGFGGLGASHPQTDAETGFYFEAKDNFTGNVRGGGPVTSPLGFVASSAQNHLDVTATGSFSPVANKLVRTQGAEHTIIYDKRIDGSLHVWLDGNTVIVYDFAALSSFGWSTLDPINWPNWAPTRFSLQTRALGENNVTFTNFEVLDATQVPEPASLGLLGLGSMLILSRRRKTA